MTSDRARSRLPTITVRLTPEEKRQFAELAASRGLSECALAVATLRALLIPGTLFLANIPNAPPREAATDRITIRLRPGDGAALEARAARRRMKASTYLAALVRSHIAADTVLTADELDSVKKAVVVLAGVGRLLSRIARCGSQGGSLSPETRQTLAQTRSVVAAVESSAQAIWPARHFGAGSHGMSRRPFRLPPGEPPFLELASLGRSGPPGSTRFSPAQIEQIRRTIRRTPEVIVKVTGGGTNPGAVAAHFAYISRKGKLEIETDEDERIAGMDAQRTFLAAWHLELSAGQYRGPRGQRTEARETKLVHKIVLSMPAPTPPEKVLAAARAFAREKFGVRHRYAMALHTDQAHPHVHLVVKAEDEYGRRLHVDKRMLREWREDFARTMREQGIAANATSRVIRGRNKGKARDGAFRAQSRGKSSAIRAKVTMITTELAKDGNFSEPARAELVETRKAVVANWMNIANTLDRQGEVILAGDVRYFAKHLPPALTDMERLAAQFAKHLASSRESLRSRQTPDVDAPVR